MHNFVDFSLDFFFSEVSYQATLAHVFFFYLTSPILFYFFPHDPFYSYSQSVANTYLGPGILNLSGFNNILRSRG